MNTPQRPVASAAILAGSPRTPQRGGISSTFSSPGFRVEEDTVIIELGTRYFRAGLTNDSSPRCILEFGPDQSRRLGDYRKWLPGYEDRTRPIKDLASWTRDYELWQLDVRDYDLSLMEHKLELMIRTAFSERLLMDAKSRKVVLVVPALTAHSVLTRILTLLFAKFQISAVTLLPPSTMAVVAAGQRSGLVIDIGWHETIITAVYEYREISEKRSTRAMKKLMTEVATFFHRLMVGELKEEDEYRTKLEFEYVEELVTQIIWCRSYPKQFGSQSSNTKIRLPLPLSSSKPVEVNFSDLSSPVESALFGNSNHQREQDDNEHDLSYLLYSSLLCLPPDVRSVCTSRIMFIGGGSNIPGLKSRLLNDLKSTVAKRGWSNIWFLSETKSSRNLTRHNESEVRSAAVADDTSPKEDEKPRFDSRLHPSLTREAEQEAAAAKSKGSQADGEIKAMESMGAFAGASMTVALGVKSLVEFDREIFLEHGLMGPRKDRESLTSRPKSFGGGLARLPTQETTYTLGAFVEKAKS